MSYKRVIPRDLFSEGSLLKCYGQLYLNLEKFGMENCLFHERERDYFDVIQDEADGSLTIQNIWLTVGGTRIRLNRPLNSLQPFPLWAYPNDDTGIPVFDEDGAFSKEMRDLLRGQEAKP